VYLQGLFRHAIGLRLLMVLVVLMLSACGGSEKGAKAHPLPEERQPLRPGIYRSEEFKPSLTFKVGEGWKNVTPETSDGMGIDWDDEPGGIGFASVHEVYKPNETGSPKLVKAPDDLVGWVEHHPYLETSEPKPVTVGGVKGKQFDVQVGDLPESYFGVCGAKCVDIARFNDGSLLAASKGIKAHAFVLEDVKGKTVLMDFSSQASDFDEFAPKAQKVVDSVKWTGL
jgi:hypothetical protein